MIFPHGARKDVNSERKSNVDFKQTETETYQA